MLSISTEGRSAIKIPLVRFVCRQIIGLAVGEAWAVGDGGETVEMVLGKQAVAELQCSACI